MRKSLRKDCFDVSHSRSTIITYAFNSSSRRTTSAQFLHNQSHRFLIVYHNIQSIIKTSLVEVEKTIECIFHENISSDEDIIDSDQIEGNLQRESNTCVVNIHSVGGKLFPSIDFFPRKQTSFFFLNFSPQWNVLFFFSREKKITNTMTDKLIRNNEEIFQHLMKRKF